MLTKCTEKKPLGKFTRILRAFLSKFWKENNSCTSLSLSSLGSNLLRLVVFAGTRSGWVCHGFVTVGRGCVTRMPRKLSIHISWLRLASLSLRGPSSYSLTLSRGVWFIAGRLRYHFLREYRRCSMNFWNLRAFKFLRQVLTIKNALC